MTGNDLVEHLAAAHGLTKADAKKYFDTVFAAIGDAAAKGDETKEQTALAKEILAKYDFDYSPAYAVGGRELHHLIFLLFDKSDPIEEKKADDCLREMITRFGEKGWAAYRTGVSTMDLVAQQYGEANNRLNAKIKQALDPNHILAPGKQGIM